MNKKRIWSTLLTLIVTLSVLISFTGTVMADPVDTNTGDSVAQTGQVDTEDPEAPETPEAPATQEDTAEPAKDTNLTNTRGSGNTDNGYDFSNLPDASFTVSQAPVKITHSKYTDVPCDVDNLVFGKIGEEKVTAGLELTFARSGMLTDESGSDICSFEVTNASHDLAAGSALKFVYDEDSVNSRIQFTIAANIDPNDYKALTAGEKYTATITYSSAWTNVINTSDLSSADNVAGPTGNIILTLVVGDPVESGTFGNGFTWELNANGELTISGEGKMPNYDHQVDTPWSHLLRDITSIKVNYGITSIGNHAFSGCHNATGITLPGTDLINIGNRAFQNCGFTSVSLPGSVTTLGEGAFFNCTRLTYIYLPDSVDSIGDYAFGYCGITSISFPSKLKEIRNGMFVNCGNLSSLSFASNSSISIIGTSAFSGCTSLKTVTLPDNVKAIADNAFKDCGIETITIPDSINSIQKGAFLNCTSLNTVYCLADPSELLFMAEEDDFKPNKATTCYVPSRFLSAYNEKFAGINISFSGYSIASGTCGANVNWMIDGDGTMFITGSGAMEDYTKASSQPWRRNRSVVKHIVFDGEITHVGNYAFSNFSNLISISFSDSLSSIGMSAFASTSSLKSMTLPDSLSIIKQNAFNGTGIESITIPASIVEIEQQAFQRSALKSVIFEEGTTITELSSSLFEDSDLESITLPEGLVTISEGAFKSCAHLNSIILPNSIKTIGSYAFHSCTDLTSINLPDGLEKISFNAFSYCYSLKTISIPGSVQTFENQTFMCCSDLTSVIIGDGVTEIPEESFYLCPVLKTVSLPDSLVSIGRYAFAVDSTGDRGAIESITIPSGVTSIGAYAFEHQNINSITIGGMTEIPGDIFKNCTQIETVTILKGTSKISNYAFDSSNGIKTVSIPGTVTSIGVRAFGTGAAMEDIYLYPNPADLTNFVYLGSNGNINASTKIHVINDFLADYRAKYPEIADQFIGDLDPNSEAQVDLGSGIHLYGYNLSLAGDIGVNFWFKINESCLADNNYIKFTVNGQEQIVRVYEASNGTDGAKVFRCSVVAKQMSDVITARFYLADGTAVGNEYSYTVKEYANYILTHDSYAQDIKNIVKTMLNYGAETQKQFNYNTSTLANSVLPDSEQTVAIRDESTIDTVDNLTVYKEPAMVSLVLNTTISLKLYFQTADVEGLTIKQGNTILDTTTSGKFTVVKINDIPASLINAFVSIQFYDANNNLLGETQYCPAQYIKLILKQPADDPVYTDDLKRLVSALYEFNQSFKAVH